MQILAPEVWGAGEGTHDPSGFLSGLVVVVPPGRRGLLFHNLSEIFRRMNWELSLSLSKGRRLC